MTDAPDPSHEARCEFCHSTTAPLITGKDGSHAHRSCAEQVVADLDQALQALGAVLEPSESELGRIAENMGIPFWMRV